MSDVQLTSANVVINTEYEQGITKLVNREAATLSKLPKRVVAGSTVRWVVEGDGATAAAHAEGSTISNFNSDAQATAYLGIGAFESAFHVSDESIAWASNVGDPSGNNDVQARQLANSLSKLGKTINGQIFGGTVSNGLTGLGTAIAASGIYAVVDPSSETSWVATVSDAGSPTDVTIAQIRGDLSLIQKASGSRPNLMVAHPAVYNEIVAEFEGSRSFTSSTAGVAPRTAYGDMQVPSVWVDGCELISDVDGYINTDSNTGYLYYLNTNHVYVAVSPYLASQGRILGNSDGLLTQVVTLAKTAHATKAAVRCMAQLVVEKRNAVGMRKNINISSIWG